MERKAMKITPSSEAKIEFDDATHCYKVDSIVKPGPSQLLAMCGLSKNVDSMPEPMRTNVIAAGNLGKVVHKWCEIFDLGDYHKYDPPKEKEQRYLDAWVDFQHDLKVELLEIEQPHYSEYGDFCGIPDRVAFIEKVPYIIDIKSAKTMNQNARLQTMGYTLFFKEKMRRMVVQLKDDGSYKIYDDGIYQKKGKPFMDDNTDNLNWESVLRVTNLIRNFR